MWLFFPTKRVVLPEALYLLVHHFLFCEGIKSFLGGGIYVPRNKVHMDVVSIYGGFWVCFTVEPDALDNLFELVSKIMEEKLPILPVSEKKRIQMQRKVHNDMDSFHQLAHDLQHKLIAQNDPQPESDPQTIWTKGIDLSGIRTLLVGNTSSAFPIKKWEKTKLKFDINLPVERKYLDWYAPVNQYTYNIFFVVESNPSSYVYMRIIDRIFVSFLSKKYVENGDSLEIRSELWCEPFYMLFGLDIDTTDTNPVKLSFPENVSEKDYNNIYEKCLFEEKYNNDALFYEEFPVLGFTPEDVSLAFEISTYPEFIKFYKNILNKYLAYWY